MLATSCDVTALSAEEVATIEAKGARWTTISVRAKATQADFDTLAKLHVATRVYVKSELVTRLDALATMSKLEAIEIDVHQLASLAALAGVPLRELSISGCGDIADLVPIRALPALENLQVGGSECMKLARLDGIERLHKLTVFARIDDASALSGATQLKSVTLHNGPIPLATIGTLSIDELELNLRKNPPGDLAQLVKLPMLRELSALDLTIDRVPALPELPKLTTLRISLFPADTSKADLAFVRKAPHLVHLSIGGVMTADLAPILALKQLETLDIAGICRVDAKPLAKLPNLKWLAVSLQVDDAHQPSRAGLEVTPSNPYRLCSP